MTSDFINFLTIKSMFSLHRWNIFVSPALRSAGEGIFKITPVFLSVCRSQLGASSSLIRLGRLGSRWKAYGHSYLSPCRRVNCSKMLNRNDPEKIGAMYKD